MADETRDLAGPPRRRGAVWTVAAAVAGLGVVVDAAVLPGQPLSPVIATFMNVGGFQARTVLFVVAGTVAGLVLLRWWRWLLLAGALLALPASTPALPWPEGAAMAYAALAGGPLALLAVLGAAQELIDGGARGLGAALAGAAAGAGLVGAALLGVAWLRTPPNLAAWQAALALLGVAGGVLAVARRPAGAGRPAAVAPRPGVWPTVLGALAALLAFVPVVLTEERVAALLQVSEQSLARRPYTMAAIVGLVTLGCAALLAAAAGAWAGAAAVTSALGQVGVTAPMILALYAVALHPAYGLGAVVIGLAAGGVAAATRWRVPFAAAAAVAGSLALLLAVAATGGDPEKLVQQARWVPSGLLLAVLVAAVTATAAGAAPAAAGRGALAAVLGPIVGALVFGGRHSLLVAQVRGGEPESSYLNGVHYLGISAGLLVAAALAVIALGIAGSLRDRGRDAPAATPETGPVRQGS